MPPRIPSTPTVSAEEALRVPQGISVVKMDLKELKTYAEKLNMFLKDPGTAALRLCECCINVD